MAVVNIAETLTIVKTEPSGLHGMRVAGDWGCIYMFGRLGEKNWAKTLVNWAPFFRPIDQGQKFAQFAFAQLTSIRFC
jgi:hypothetical protein